MNNMMNHMSGESMRNHMPGESKESMYARALRAGNQTAPQKTKKKSASNSGGASVGGGS